MRMGLLGLIGVAIIGHLAASALRAADESASKPLPVFVLAGTSNMLGRNAKTEDLPDDLRKPLSDVLALRGGEWQPLEAGKNLIGNEAVFGRALAEHLGRPVGVVLTSVRYAAEKSPGPAIVNLVAQSARRGRPVKVVGMVVDVSYGDGRSEETAKAYGENMVRWIENVRRELGDPQLPIVLMRAIPPRSADSPLEKVRQAQDALKVSNFRLVNSDEIERGSDRVHFTTAGRLNLGKRYAAAMIELLEAKK